MHDGAMPVHSTIQAHRLPVPAELCAMPSLVHARDCQFSACTHRFALPSYALPDYGQDAAIGRGAVIRM